MVLIIFLIQEINTFHIIADLVGLRLQPLLLLIDLIYREEISSHKHLFLLNKSLIMVLFQEWGVAMVDHLMKVINSQVDTGMLMKLVEIMKLEILKAKVLLK